MRHRLLLCIRKRDGMKGCMKKKTRKKRDELEGGGRNRDMVKDLGRAIWVTVTLTSTPVMDLISSLQLIRVSLLLPEALEMLLRTHQST